MSQENKDKQIDPETLGSRYQKQARNIAKDLTDPQKRVEKPKKEHDPFPAQSSKHAAIKTYKDYAAESLHKGGGSLAKMIIAEREKKREKKRRSAGNPKNIAMTVLSIVFVILGLGLVVGAFYLVKSVHDDPRGKEIIIPKPLIVHDYRSEAYVAKINRTKLIKEIESQLEGVNIEVGAVKYIYFVTNNQFGGKTLMTTEDFLEGLRAKVSSAFIRSLNENFMFGVFSTTENAPFLILKTDNFTTSYAEMLSWERTMGIDLAAVLGASNFDYARSSFVDVVYYNNDARAILDIEGNPVIGYSFVDPRTIVLFSNKLVLREVVSRMQRNTLKE